MLLFQQVTGITVHYTRHAIRKRYVVLDDEQASSNQQQGKYDVHVTSLVCSETVKSRYIIQAITGAGYVLYKSCHSPGAILTSGSSLQLIISCCSGNSKISHLYHTSYDSGIKADISTGVIRQLSILTKTEARKMELHQNLN